MHPNNFAQEKEKELEEKRGVGGREREENRFEKAARRVQRISKQAAHVV